MVDIGTPQVTFISALFLPPGGSYRSVDAYKQHFATLARTGIPVCLFLDPALRSYGEELERDWPNVRVLDYCLPDKSFLAGLKEGQPYLPARRNEKKDTVDYMCVQLMKLQVCARAAEIVHTPFLAWIDFGIAHMFKDTARCTEMLVEACRRSTWPRDKILSPGCWAAGSYPIWTSICWRHCGSFLLGARELFGPAAETQMDLVVKNLPGLTWEVNYWSGLERLFHVYTADHNDSILSGLLALEGVEP